MIFSAAAGASSREKLFGLLSKQKENYEKELQIVKETTEEVDKRKTEIFTKHAEELDNIEKEYDIKLEDLKEEKQKALANTIEENKDKPDELAEEIAKILSAEYFEKNR